MGNERWREANDAVGAGLIEFGAEVAVVFRPVGCGCSIGSTLRTQLRSSFWIMVASGLGRSANGDRSISKFGVKHRIMPPAPVVARDIGI